METPSFGADQQTFLNALMSETSITDYLNKEKLEKLFKNVRIEKRSGSLEMTEFFLDSLNNDGKRKKFNEIGSNLAASAAR